MKGSTTPTNPLYLLFFLLVERLFGKKKKRHTRCSTSLTASRKQRKKENLTKMQSITARYKDYTAEVFTFYVKDIERVKRFRQVNVGDSLEIKLLRNIPKVFVDGEYMADLHPDSSSRIEHLLREGRRINAYLGGRDLSQLYNIKFDFCSLIIFYKLPGVGPTIVKIES